MVKLDAESGFLVFMDKFYCFPISGSLFQLLKSFKQKRHPEYFSLLFIEPPLPASITLSLAFSHNYIIPCIYFFHSPLIIIFYHRLALSVWFMLKVKFFKRRSICLNELIHKDGKWWNIWKLSAFSGQQRLGSYFFVCWSIYLYRKYIFIYNGFGEIRYTKNP